MTPDELKAIAERADRYFRAMRAAESQLEFKGWSQIDKDYERILSHIQDIRRDTAREIVEMIEKESAFIERHCTRDDNRIAHAFRQQMVSIRSAYGVEG